MLEIPKKKAEEKKFVDKIRENKANLNILMKIDKEIKQENKKYMDKLQKKLKKQQKKLKQKYCPYSKKVKKDWGDNYYGKRNKRNWSVWFFRKE